MVFNAGLAWPDQARIVRYDDGAPAVSDGPFPEGKEFLIGFWVVDCVDEPTPTPDPGTERMTTPTISAGDVKALRDRTGAGMMDCKRALRVRRRHRQGRRDPAGQEGKKIGARRPRGDRGHRAVLHPRQRQGRRARRGRLQHRLRRHATRTSSRFAREVAMQIAASPRRATSPGRGARRRRRTRRRGSSSRRRPTSPRTSARRSSRASSKVAARRSCCSTSRRQPASSRARRCSSCATSSPATTGENVVIAASHGSQVGESSATSRPTMDPPSNGSC